MKISIIVPIYNAEKYLSRCLDSILAIKSVDWECVLVDDGSTDSSWNIICKYTKQSNRFVAMHQENAGVSSARNLGLNICSGGGIMFVDPDDYFFPEADSLLHFAVTQYADYDMVLFPWVDVCQDGTKRITEIPAADFGNCGDWIKKTVLFAGTMSTCWSRLYKRSIIAKNKICFDTSMRVAEDGSFVAEYLNYCHTITIVGNEPVYAYFQNKGSAIRKFYPNDIFDELRAYEKKLVLAKNRNVFLLTQEKMEMDNFFFYAITRYANSCAECHSRKAFRDIMSRVFEDERLLKIVCNCGSSFDTIMRKFTKFLMRNQLFCLYWYMEAVKRQIKKLR